MIDTQPLGFDVGGRGFGDGSLGSPEEEHDDCDGHHEQDNPHFRSFLSSLNSSHDHDWYRFDAEEGDVIMINYEVTQFADLYDPEFTLYDPQGNVIYSDIAPPRTVTAETAGTYHLHIAQEDETTPAAFRNRLGYALTVRLNEEVPPAAGVTFTDQESDGTHVVIDEVTVPEGGFVAIYDERLITGEDLVEGVRGVSSFLETGSHEQVAVTLADPITETQRL